MSWTDESAGHRKSLWRKWLSTVSAVALCLGAAAGVGALAAPSIAGAATNDPTFTVSPGSLNFNPVVVGTAPESLTVTVHVNVTAPTPLTTLTLTASTGGSAVFTVTANPCIGVMQNDKCTVTVTFTPGAVGAVTGTLTLTDPTEPSNSKTVSLNGAGIAPAHLQGPGAVNFGHVTKTGSATQVITISNVGGSPATISSVAALTAPFSIVSTNCSATTLYPPASTPLSSSCTIVVKFAPTATGSFTGTLTVSSTTAGVQPVTVHLEGIGDAQGVNVSPASLTFGAVQVGTTSPAQSFTVTNDSGGGVSVTVSSPPTITGNNKTDFTVQSNDCPASPAKLATGTSCTVSVTFTPTEFTTPSESATLTFTAGTAPSSVLLNGYSLAPHLVAVPLSPSSLDFGNQAVGTTSAPSSVTIYNLGTAPVDLTGVTPTFTTGDFTVATNGCTGALAPFHACDIAVVFTPIAAGPASSTLSIPVPAGAGTPTPTSLTVNMKGTGVYPSITVAPTSIPFGTQAIGVPTADHLVTVTNDSGNGAALTLTGITLDPAATSPFTLDHSDGTCWADITGTIPLLDGDSCTAGVSFTPTANAQVTATLNVASDAHSGNSTVALSGSGLGGLSVSPSSLNFHSIGVSDTSAQQTVTVQWTGSGDLKLGKPVVSADPTDYTINGGSCTTGTTLVPTSSSSDSCTVIVQFNPQVLGTLNGLLSIPITTPADLSSIVVPLTGTGVANTTATITPTSYTFGSVSVGGSSVAQAFVVKNTGTNPLHINTATVIGTGKASFTPPVNDTCATATVLPGATCTVSVVFSPTTTGALSASLKIFANTTGLSGPGSPLVATLTGTGLSPSAGVTATPPFVSFGTVGETITSPVHYVTVTNHGASSVTLGAIAVPTNHDYTIVADHCATTTLGAGDHCVVGVTFTPTVLGNDDGTLTVPVTGGSTLTVALYGVGSNSVSALVTPSKLTFGPTAVNATSAQQTVTVTNNGQVPLTVSTVAIVPLAATFAVANDTCLTASTTPPTPVTLAPTAKCVISVTFSPTTVSNTLSASLNIVDNAGTQTVTLTGTSKASASTLTFSPSPVTFGSVGVSDTSLAQTVTVTNTGTNPVAFSTAVISGPDATEFHLTDGCSGQTLDADGGTCIDSVTFAPTSFGSQSATLTFTQAGTTATSTVTLRGTGVANTTATITPTSQTFGSVSVGGAGTAQAFVVKNTGTNPLHISTVTVIGTGKASFTPPVNDTCATATVLPGATCTVSVVFSPTTTGALSASLKIFANTTGLSGPGSPLVATLTGTGLSPSAGVTATPPFVSFGTVGETITSPVHYVTVTNHGASSVTLGAIAVPTNHDYTIVADHCATTTLGAGDHCVVGVTFTPTVLGNDDGTLTVPVTGGSTLTVALYGVGSNSVSALVTPSKLTFGPTAVNATSAQQTVTVTNNGQVPLTVSTVAIVPLAATFAVANDTCLTASTTPPTPVTLAPTAKCVISVTFSPTTVSNTLSASLNIVDNAGTQTVTLTGTSKASASTLTFSPSPVTFGSVGVSDTSLAQTVTVTNTGTNPVAFSTAVISGPDATEFHLTDGCSGQTLDADGGTCIDSVTFAPTSFGSQSATLTFTQAGTTATSTVTLRGTGVANTTATITPTSQTFGSVSVGGAGTAQAFVVKNTGTNPLHISTVTVIGTGKASFTPPVNDTCATATVLPGATCTVSVVFSPTTTGALSASLKIFANTTGLSGPGSPLVATLTGTGLSPSAGVTATPPFVSFGTVGETITSPVHYVTVTNHGASSVTLGAIAVPTNHDYTIVADHCATTTLGAGDHCVVGVTFTPTVLGNDDGTLTVPVTGGSTLTVALYGVGSNSVSALVTPSKLTFGPTAVNATSAQQTVTVTNNGQVPLTVSTVAIVPLAATFAVANDTCLTASTTPPTPVTLAPTAKCVISVTFSPTTVSNTLSASLNIVDNAGTQTVTLTGTSKASASTLTFSPSPVTFGSVGVSDTSLAQTVTVTNTGTNPVAFSTAVISGPDATEFHLTDGCSGQTLDADGGTCIDSVTFAPTSFGSQSATLTFTQAGTTATSTVTLRGTGVANTTATITPTSQTFGSVSVGGAGTAQAFVVKNTGTNPLHISTVTVIGTGKASFTPPVNDTCATATVLPGATCTVSVVFSPTTTGALSASLKIFANTTGLSGPGSPLVATLTGTGLSPSAGVTATPPFVSFGTVGETITSPVHYVTVTNHGASSVTLGAIAVPTNHDYTIVADHCATTTLGAGDHCVVGVTFTPTVLGNDDGTLTVPVTGGSTLTVALYGVGSNSVSALVTPSKLTFGPTAVNATSAQQTVTVTNNGQVPLTVSTVAIVPLAATFAVANDTCLTASTTPPTPVTLAPTAKCVISVTFSPTTVSNTLSASLNIVDNAGTQTVTLTGTSKASASTLTFSPSPVTFGSVGVSDTSLAQTVTVTNTGTNPVAFSTAVISGPDATEFHLTDGCSGQTLDADGGTCIDSVTFAPTSFGSQSATLTFTQAGTTATSTVTLRGTGVANTTATITPTSQTFGSVSVGGAGTAQAFVVKNTGTNPLHISTVTVIGTGKASFTPPVNDTCATATVLPGATCTVSVVFSPTTTGALSASLKIFANTTGLSGPGSPLVATLTGTGLSPSAGVTATPPFVSFGTVGETITSPVHYVTVTNHGASSVTLGAIAVPTNHDYTIVADHCATTTLGAGDHCVVGVTFTPTVLGNDDGTLTVPVTGGSTLTVALYGVGSNSVSALVTPSKLTFGPTAVNATSAQQTVTVTNNGQVPLTVSTVAIVPLAATFAVANDTCLTASTTPPTPVTLAPTAKCVISVTFSPTTVSNTLSASLNIVDNAGTQTVTLTGTSKASASTLTFSPSPVTFGSVGVSDTSLAQTVTVTNTGTNPVAFSTAVISGPDATEFHLTDGCSGQTLDADGGTCIDSVTFAPTSFGSQSATLTFTQAGTTATSTVTLRGTGVANTTATITPTSQTFGTVTANTSSAAEQFVVTNTGTNPLAVTTATVDGKDATSFTIVGNTCTGYTVTPGTTCTVSVVFTPTSTTSDLSASLNVTANTSGTDPSPPLTVALSGNGRSPSVLVTATPPYVEFGTQAVGVTSPIHYVTVTNHGSQTVPLGTIAVSTATSPTGVSTDFTVLSNTCPTTLPAHSSCTVGLTFTPTVYGTESATLQVPVVGGSTLDVGLYGTGANLTVLVTPTSLTFGPTAVNATSAEQTVTITNTSATDLKITAITPSGSDVGDFNITDNTCILPYTLHPNESCSFQVTFTPTTVSNTLSGDFNITDGAGSQTVTLKGTSTASATTLTISPSPVTFGSIGVSDTSAAQTVTVTNTGTNPVAFSTAVISGPDATEFHLTDNCKGQTLDADGGTCIDSVTFTPTSFGPQSATLTFTQTGTMATSTVTLKGTGVASTSATVSPSTIKFGTVQVTTSSGTELVTVTNTGNNPLHIGFDHIGGNDPSSFRIVTDTCQFATVDPGKTCTLYVVFKPTTTTSDLSATLEIGANVSGTGGFGNPALTVALSGNGATPSAGLSASPSPVTFGSIGVNTTTPVTSPVHYVVVTNNGTQTVKLKTVAITPTIGSDYSLTTDTCAGGSLPKGGTCIIGVTFSPTKFGTVDSTLQVEVTGGAPLVDALNGTGASLTVSVTPQTLSFPATQVGATSAEKTVTIKNTSASDLTITTIVPSGSDVGDFNITDNTCILPYSLGPTQSCSFQVTFSPATVSNTLSGDFNITDSAGVQTITLSGIGTASASKVLISPNPVSFGTVGISDTSAAQTVTVTNAGTKPVTFGTAVISGADKSEFTPSGGTCSGATLDAPASGVGNTSCTLTVTFRPTSYGPQSAILSLPQSGTTSPTSQVVLTGTGIANTTATVTPPSITFGKIPEKTSSTAKLVTVTNTGTNPLHIGFDHIGGNDPTSFSIVTDTCRFATVAPGTTCTLYVVFTPTGITNTLSATLEIGANVSGTGGFTNPALTVALQGDGTKTGTTVVATPSPVSFGAVGLTVTSPIHYVTITNNGNSSVTLTTATIVTPADGFATTADACSGQKLAKGGTCQIGVTFTPGATEIGFESNTLQIVITGGTTVDVGLYGLGVATTEVSIAPTGVPATPPKLNFPKTGKGEVSPQEWVQVTNVGFPNPLIISSVAISEGPDHKDFTLETDSCTGNTLAPGGSCWLGVSFTPGTTATAKGTLTASILIDDNALSSQQVVALSGVVGGSSNGVGYTVSPTSLAFGNVGVGLKSASQKVTVTNISTSEALTFPSTGAVTLSDTTDYTVTVSADTCTGQSIAPGTTCTVQVTFNPQSLGNLTGNLIIAPVGSPTVVPLTGAGVSQLGPPAFSMHPGNNGTLAFPDTVVGQTSGEQSVLLKVTSVTPLTVTQDVIKGADAGQFSIVSDTCQNNQSLSNGASCAIAIVFSPTSVGAKTAQLLINDNVSGSPQVVNLTGTGVPVTVPPTGPTTGYWMVAADGGIFSYGNAKYYGSTGNLRLQAPIVGMAATPTGGGYWLAAADGGIFAFGNAQFYGSMGGTPLVAPVVAIVATPDGRGYWMVASDGGIFTFGDAGFYGSMGGKPLNQPIVGMTATATGGGYWEVAADGGIFAFGNAQFYGSMGGKPLNKPIVGMEPSTDGGGYFLVASDGGVFAFGDAVFHGSAASLNLKAPITGMVPTADGGGYWQVATDGGVFAFGDAPFFGSLGGITLNKPIVGLARD